MSTLEIAGLDVRFGTTRVLNGLDLLVPSGAVLAVLGPSGCGKTTLLRAVAGFTTPHAGRISLGGRLVSQAGPGLASVQEPPERRRIGIVPQEGALFPHLDVARNVAFGLRQLPRRARDDRVAELLDLLGLRGLDHRMPAQLSGGQQQRVALARALAPRPDVVLLDEPFGALDAGLRASTRDDVRAALQADGATGVLVTHDQGEALSVSDLVAVLRGGAVAQVGPAREVYRRPSDLSVATFVGEAVVLPARLIDAGSDSPGGGDAVARTVLGDLVVSARHVPRGPGESAGTAAEGHVVVRPEQIDLLPMAVTTAMTTAATSTGVVAEVQTTLFHGSASTVRLSVAGAEGHQDVEIAARVHGDPPPPGPVMVAVRGTVPFYCDGAP